MGQALISWPFRIAPNGSAVTRPDDTPEYYAEEIMQMVTTRTGERPLVPGFGVADPTFAYLDPNELAIRCDTYSIPARIVDVETQTIGDGRQDVLVTYAPLDNSSTAAAVRVNTSDLEIP